MKNLKASFFTGALVFICLSACHPINKSTSRIDEAKVDMHIAYDDSTLNNKVLPIMLPYNRVIDPAGKVVRFGDPPYRKS